LVADQFYLNYAEVILIGIKAGFVLLGRPIRISKRKNFWLALPFCFTDNKVAKYSQKDYPTDDHGN